MELKDWILLIGTFVIGVCTGVYLHFSIFVPEYVVNEDLSKLQQAAESDFQIVAQMYGGCQMMGTCPSFQLSGNRVYKYVPQTDRGEVAAVYEGKLPRVLMTQIEAAWIVANPEDVTAAISKEWCAHWSDGIDYEYIITDTDGTYILDTCYTDLAPDSDLAAALQSVFRYLDDPEEYAAHDTSSANGLGGIIEETLEETFDWQQQ